MNNSDKMLEDLANGLKMAVKKPTKREVLEHYYNSRINKLKELGSYEEAERWTKLRDVALENC